MYNQDIALRNDVAFLRAKLKIAKAYKVSFNQVEIYYHECIGEYCINVKGEHKGYFYPEDED